MNIFSATAALRTRCNTYDRWPAVVIPAARSVACIEVREASVGFAHNQAPPETATTQHALRLRFAANRVAPLRSSHLPKFAAAAPAHAICSTSRCLQACR